MLNETISGMLIHFGNNISSASSSGAAHYQPLSGLVISSSSVSVNNATHHKSNNNTVVPSSSWFDSNSTSFNHHDAINSSSSSDVGGTIFGGGFKMAPAADDVDDYVTTTTTYYSNITSTVIATLTTALRIVSLAVSSPSTTTSLLANIDTPGNSGDITRDFFEPSLLFPVVNSATMQSDNETLSIEAFNVSTLFNSSYGQSFSASNIYQQHPDNTSSFWTALLSKPTTTTSPRTPLQKLNMIIAGNGRPFGQTVPQTLPASFDLLTTTALIDERESNELHSVAATLELQRYGILALLIALVLYISIINLVAIVTLIYGMVSPSAALSIRMVLVRKRPVRLSMAGDEAPPPFTEPSPAKSSVKSTSTAASGRRTAVIACSADMPEELVQLDSTAYPYLLSLAFSDFLIGCVIAPLQLDMYINNRWRFSTELCDFWLAMDIFFSTSSTLHTAAIAVDRWWTITRLQASLTPQTPQMSLQKTMLIFIWMLAALVSFPVIYLWQIETPGQETRKRNPDQCEPVADDTYILLSTLVSFCLPLTLTIVFYVQTALRIRKQYNAAKFCVRQMSAPIDDILSEQEQQSSSTDNGTTTIDRTSEAIQKTTQMLASCRAEAMRLLEKHLQMLNHHRVMLRAMTLIVIVYCLCWTPLYTVLFVKAVCGCVVGIKAQHTWGQLVTMFSWLGYANSGINPIIYFAALDEFKALAVALIWVIIDRIKRTIISVAVFIRDYFVTVFCCVSQPLLWIARRGSQPQQQRQASQMARTLGQSTSKAFNGVDHLRNFEHVSETAVPINQDAAASPISSTSSCQLSGDSSVASLPKPRVDPLPKIPNTKTSNVPSNYYVTTQQSVLPQFPIEQRSRRSKRKPKSPNNQKLRPPKTLILQNPTSDNVILGGYTGVAYNDRNFHRFPFNQAPFNVMPVQLPQQHQMAPSFYYRNRQHFSNPNLGAYNCYRGQQRRQLPMEAIAPLTPNISFARQYQQTYQQPPPSYETYEAIKASVRQRTLPSARSLNSFNTDSWGRFVNSHSNEATV